MMCTSKTVAASAAWPGKEVLHGKNLDIHQVTTAVIEADSLQLLHP